MKRLFSSSTLLALCALSALSAAVSAQETAPALPIKILPVHGVFLADENQTDPGQGLIDPAFATWLKGTGGAKRGELADRYVALMKQAFRDSVIETLEQGKQRRMTVAASFQILRASRFAVKKPDGTMQIMLPVTASICLTNLGSGEVLSAYTATYIPSKRVDGSAGGVGEGAWTELYEDAVTTITRELIGSAKTGFRPRIESAAVRGKWKNLYILDAGKGKGLVEPDSLSDDAGHTCKIVRSDESYSVCEPGSTAEIPNGTVFSRETSMDANRLKKPRALVIFGDSSSTVPQLALSQVFADQISGAAAPISVVPVNPMFSQVLGEIDVATRSSSDDGVLGRRDVPDLFVRLSLSNPLVYSVSTNLNYVRTRYARALVSADVEDGNGRILFSASGQDVIKEDIAHDVGVADADRAESVMKNALLDLAKKIAAGLKLHDDQLALTRTGPNPRIADPNGLLVPSANYWLFRRIGRLPGIEGDVTVPVAQLRTIRIEGNEVEAKVVESQDVPAEGDYVVVRRTSSNIVASRNRFAICADVRAAGEYQSPFVRSLLISRLGSGIAYPYFDLHLPDEVGRAIGGAMEFKADIGLQRAQVDYCIEPAYRVVNDGNKCESGKCADHVRVAVQFGTKRNDAPVANDALEAGYSIMQVQADESTVVRGDVIRGELAEMTGGLADQVIGKMNARTY